MRHIILAVVVSFVACGFSRAYADDRMAPTPAERQAAIEAYLASAPATVARTTFMKVSESIPGE